jgi:predicted ATPase/DNA-binding winged helix-turn-helix (wHTH) protein
MDTANVTARRGSAAAMVSFHAARDYVQPNPPRRSDTNSEYSFSFGPYQLFPRQRLLLKDGKPLQVGCKSLDILIALAERQGEVVGKRELLARAWPGVMVVEDGTLRVQMTCLRRALGDGSWIRTVAGRGYCLVADEGSPESTAVSGCDVEVHHTPQLPLHLDRMIGRSDDIRKISTLLEMKRFVTILGAGGVGKTTTAVSVGHAQIASFAGAVHLLDLGRITEARLLPGALASLFALSVQSDDPTPELLEYLRDRRMLLIFDSCEHLIEQAAVLIERIFHGAPQVSILATSREMLRVDGEHVYRLSGLECPRDDDGQSAKRVFSFAGPRLFADRVEASGYQFELSDADASAVAWICRKLDGIALAINLAAARAQIFGLSEVSGSLESQRWLLWRGQRTALPRHQTMAATVEWSYGLLSEAEQAMLRSLAIFDGAFSLDAAREIARHSLADPSDDLLIIDKLVAKSYRLLNATRAFALEKLQHLGEFDATAAKAREYASGRQTASP